MAPVDSSDELARFVAEVARLEVLGTEVVSSVEPEAGQEGSASSGSDL